MRFALSVPPFTDPHVVVEWAGSAEANGWDGFFLWDHLRWDDRVEVHDPWVLLGAIASSGIPRCCAIIAATAGAQKRP